jgi:hypothetical protein
VPPYPSNGFLLLKLQSKAKNKKIAQVALLIAAVRSPHCRKRRMSPLSALLARNEKEQAYEVSLGCKEEETYELWIAILGAFYFAYYYYFQ